MNATAFLHPVMEQVALDLRRATGGTVTSTYRSVAEQTKLRAAYEQGRARFPAERPGASTHHTGLAFDFVVPQGAASPHQTALGRWWLAQGGYWSEKDRIHFQHPEARAILAQGFVQPKWWLRSR